MVEVGGEKLRNDVEKSPKQISLDLVKFGYIFEIGMLKNRNRKFKLIIRTVLFFRLINKIDFFLIK